MAPIAPLAIFAASAFVLMPSPAELPSGPLLRAVVAQETEPPIVVEDPTIDRAGKQMIVLLGGLTAGAVTGKALLRR